MLKNSPFHSKVYGQTQLREEDFDYMKFCNLNFGYPQLDQRHHEVRDPPEDREREVLGVLPGGRHGDGEEGRAEDPEAS